jgi:serine/threonine protein kinase
MPYLVMPPLKGCPLGDLLAGPKPIVQVRLIDIICQTLFALKAAHDAQIIHRDLKPDNIFVSRFGDREDFVKLLDFGISKILDQDSVSKLTRTGTVVGTPSYMSPEQARGVKAIDHLVDIYAVGVILYEGLTGKLPFDGDSYNEVMFKIVSEPFPALRSLNPSIPPVLEQIVLKSMSRHPPERYQSAEQMREALEQAVVDSSIPSNAALTSSTTAVVDREPFTPTQAKAIATPSSKLETDIRESGLDSDFRSSGLSAYLRVRSNKKILFLTMFGIGLLLAVLSFALYKTGKVEETEDLQVVSPAPAQATEKIANTELPEPKTELVNGIEPPAIEIEPPSPKLAKSKKNTPKRPTRKKKASPRTGVESPSARPKMPETKPSGEKEVLKGRFGTEFVFD